MKSPSTRIGASSQTVMESEVMTSEIFLMPREYVPNAVESFAGGLVFTSEIVRMALDRPDSFSVRVAPRER